MSFLSLFTFLTSEFLILCQKKSEFLIYVLIPYVLNSCAFMIINVEYLRITLDKTSSSRIFLMSKDIRDIQNLNNSKYE